MFRCVRIWTDREGNSEFEEGFVELPKGERGDALSAVFKSASISFRETAPGGAYEWHPAPIRQFVLTLSGTLEFETKRKERFTIRPGDILLAEDTTGSGHRWKLLGDDPWRRAYVILADGIQSGFVASASHEAKGQTNG
ncbi:hypothetical protein D3C71_1515040 [compost metagenome]